MRVVMFCHSLVSDWNHGNAHFLRGCASELIARGHEVLVYEPANNWSLENLLREHGAAPIRRFHETYPLLRGFSYWLETLDLNRALEGANLVIVHEWNDHELIRRIGQHHQSSPHYRLLFHDTHHRSVTDPESMVLYDLSGFDGVLAFGNVIRDLYIRKGWAAKAWTWHEAADIRVFYPRPGKPDGDLVWVGNWGDNERTAELHEFLLGPVGRLRLRARVHGVRYPKKALDALAKAWIQYGGWLPNFEAPGVFGHFKVTVHVPRRPYTQALPGIPTIRPFEALACGIPLVSAPWEDAEGLFTPGRDFLVARSGQEMEDQLRMLVHDEDARKELATHGLETIMKRHTCAHRVDELLGIYQNL